MGIGSVGIMGAITMSAELVWLVRAATGVYPRDHCALPLPLFAVGGVMLPALTSSKRACFFYYFREIRWKQRHHTLPHLENWASPFSAQLLGCAGITDIKSAICRRGVGGVGFFFII